MTDKYRFIRNAHVCIANNWERVARDQYKYVEELKRLESREKENAMQDTGLTSDNVLRRRMTEKKKFDDQDYLL